jgi:hypothetical protein
MSDLEPNDPVWNVLGHAKQVEPSPFFARNVVREARHLAEMPAGFRGRMASFLSIPRAVFATAGLALLAVTLVLLAPHGQEATNGPSLSTNEDNAEAFDPASEIANVEYLGQLMAVADPGQLDDAALADLFF